MLQGRLISINIGQSRTVQWSGQFFKTAIFKEPVPGRVKIRKLGLEGDVQADLTVHGGLEKAVYAYPSEHYPYWRRELNISSLPWGMFGENLTTEGLLENQVHLGDEIGIGTSTLKVTQPRFPCFKLGIKFGTMEMVKRFQASGRSGFYFSVMREGDIGAGDNIKLIKSTTNPTVTETFTSESGEQ